MPMVTIKLPEEVLTAARIEKAHASEELRKIVALELYRENAISIGKASEIAGMSIADFMDLSANAKILLHYTLEDLRTDRDTIKRMSL